MDWVAPLMKQVVKSQNRMAGLPAFNLSQIPKVFVEGPMMDVNRKAKAISMKIFLALGLFVQS